MLRSDLLGYRAHWITPEFEPRRYDTRFFSARRAAGPARPTTDTTEADVADWVRPADLLRAWRDGRALMLPPTVVGVEEVAAADVGRRRSSPSSRRSSRRCMPELVDTGDGLVMRADLPR